MGLAVQVLKLNVNDIVISDLGHWNIELLSVMKTIDECDYILNNILMGIVFVLYDLNYTINQCRQ